MRQAGLVLETSECMRRSIKQFELSGQRRDTQTGLGARQVGFKCVQFVSGFLKPLEPTDFAPIKRMQLERFDGATWQLFGEVISASGS
jgi:hypothetical protein